jgi:hypothetical protein
MKKISSQFKNYFFCICDDYVKKHEKKPCFSRLFSDFPNFKMSFSYYPGLGTLSFGLLYGDTSSFIKADLTLGFTGEGL